MAKFQSFRFTHIKEPQKDEKSKKKKNKKNKKKNGIEVDQLNCFLPNSKKINQKIFYFVIFFFFSGNIKRNITTPPPHHQLGFQNGLKSKVS